MAIFNRSTPELGTILNSKLVNLHATSEDQRTAAAEYRAAAFNADQVATEAAAQAGAVHRALGILEEAGVVV